MTARPFLAAILATTLLCGCGLGKGLTVGFPEAARIERGEAVFRKVCAACHGLAGRPSARPDAPPFERIAQRYSSPGLARELEAIGDVGHYGMPVIRLSPKDQRDLIAYVASLKVGDAAH